MTEEQLTGGEEERVRTALAQESQKQGWSSDKIKPDFLNLPGPWTREAAPGDAYGPQE